jgi:hypothetical protein
LVRLQLKLAIPKRRKRIHYPDTPQAGAEKIVEDLRMSEGEARKLDSPLMILSLDDEIARLKSGAQWASNGRAAITLMKTPEFRIVLIALGLHKIMHEHRAEAQLHCWYRKARSA